MYHRQLYVSGFLINTEKTHIVLIHKNRGPKSIIGKWVGVGGKVEPHENFWEAQIREFGEEAGVLIDHWTHFATFIHDVYDLRFYYSKRPMKELLECKTMEDEVVEVIAIKDLHNYDLAYGTRFLIPLLLSDFVVWPVHFEINGNRED